MLIPNVLGQSGTAIPTRYVVTEPPTKSRGRVNTAANKAIACGPRRYPGRTVVQERLLRVVMIRAAGLGASVTLLQLTGGEAPGQAMTGSSTMPGGMGSV